MFSNTQSGGSGLFGNKPAGGGGGGLFGNQQQGTGGGGGGLFGNQQQGAGGGSGGGLFGNKPAGGGGGGLFGSQQQGTGGGGGGLFGSQQQGAGGGGGLFGNKPAGTTLGTGGGGGLFSQGAGQGGGLFNKPAGGGGGLFPSQGQGQGTGSQFSLFPGQRPGVGQGGMFGGPGMGGYPDLASRSKQSRFQLSLTNPIRDRKVGTLGDKYKQFVEAASKTLNANERQIETLKIVNEDIVKKKAELSGITYQFSQDAKQLYMKIKQARYIVDDMKSSLGTYEDITTRNFDVCLDLLKGGRLPRLDMPSNFLINITEYFDLRIRELKDKIGEIEELIKLTDMNEDSEEYEKIVMVIDELYNYYLNIAHKVFQLNEYVSSFKAQFIDYFKSQGSREVERIFTTRTSDSERVDILGRLETISNYVLENKAKKEKEQEDIAKSLTKQGQTY